MTKPIVITISCPCCSQEFETQVLFSYNTFGRKTTDLFQEGAGALAIEYLIHSCKKCGYSGYMADFENVQLSQQQAKHPQEYNKTV